MHKTTVFIVAIVGVIGLAVAAAILRTDPGSGGAAEPAGALDYPRGPHGARLLSADGLQVEMTIYETGVPPQFRVYPFDAALKALPPGEVELVVELHRLGGRIDRITFTPEADYLRGIEVVEEPHSFDVKVFATRGGQEHSWSYAQIEGKVQLGADQIKSAGIVIGTVGPRTMQTILELPGEIKADETRVAHVVPRLQGVVTEVLKKEGDRVRQGEVLAILSSRELANAKSQYLTAAHHVEFARVTLDREEALWKKKISAERDYLEAKRVLDESELTLQLAGQQLGVLGMAAAALPGLAAAPADTFARYEVRAPLAGTVVERDVTVGEAVSADERIFTIADLTTVWVEVSVYAKDLGVVRQGQEAAVLSTDLGTESKGRINFIGQLVGKETRAATARLTLSNANGQWRPGLFVTVTLVREETVIALAVSADAIQTFRDWQVVFVKYGDWFEARPLELGRTDGQWVEVLSGLKAGDLYAAANSFAVKAEIGKLGATHDH
ncbi:MAG: efflux RND transporter periplasmic adaptor subunit [Acidobacteria bacterium]|jgi:membrane fusion protein, heavy metal efflux system|nr:efflux RND transporter periplasmic adaptor subunit [Acidobacteriota bacterium]